MLAALRLLVAASVLFGSVVLADRIPDPFGGDTMAVAGGPLVDRWSTVTAQIEHDKAAVESCLTGGSEECAPALRLLAIVAEARQQHGLAVIGHINRAINAMIRPAPGEWIGPLTRSRSAAAIARLMPLPSILPCARPARRMCVSLSCTTRRVPKITWSWRSTSMVAGSFSTTVLSS
jgi:hypothetical protein